jgi:hypothetical protein
MARRNRTFWEAKPQKPIRYGAFGRLADRRAGRSDGKSGKPPLPAVRTEDLPTDLITPYLESIYQIYKGSTEAESRTALRDVADAIVRRRVLQKNIASREERSRNIQKQLDAMPEIPDDTFLGQRNATEQHADAVLVRTRRLREYTAAREKIQTEMDQSDEKIVDMLAEFAEASENVAVRRQALAIRVAQMRAHALRRRGCYLRHLESHHPDGPALSLYFDFSPPDLPSWLKDWPSGEVAGAAGI